MSRKRISKTEYLGVEDTIENNPRSNVFDLSGYDLPE